MWHRKTISTRQLPLQTNYTTSRYDYLELTACYTVSQAQKCSPYDVVDAVWVKPSDNRCHTKYKLGTGTRVVSQQTMEVDGMPRHVLDLRSAVPPGTAPMRAQTFIGDDEDLRRLPALRGSEGESSGSEEEVDRPLPRRSGR